ncbi:MAG: hypothetical protein B6I22_10225 [Desulfobacteraceae bacterium 4572_123]|nr:MAG: hypothetical protein B6I22_10225 [Desulfobacteraceae bacterium 4572_123]
MSVVQIISAITLGLASLVLTLIAAVIILMMYRGTLDNRVLNFLYETSADGRTGKPSVSRLQMLIWNFVVAFAFLYVLGNGGIDRAIAGLLTPEVLILLGISNSTYLLGKRTRQGSAISKTAAAAGTADTRGGQPVAVDEDSTLGPGPQGIQ